MMRVTSIRDTGDVNDTRQALASQEVNIFLMPGSLYKRLSDEAAKRNMTVVQLLGAALDYYITGEVRKKAPQNEDDGPQLLTRKTVPSKSVKRALKGYR